MDVMLTTFSCSCWLSSRSWLPFLPSPPASGPCFVTCTECIAVIRGRAGSRRSSPGVEPAVCNAGEGRVLFAKCLCHEWNNYNIPLDLKVEIVHIPGCPTLGLSPGLRQPCGFVSLASALCWSRPGGHILPCMIAFLGEVLGAPSQTSSSTCSFNPKGWPGACLCPPP